MHSVIIPKTIAHGLIICMMYRRCHACSIIMLLLYSKYVIYSNYSMLIGLHFQFLLLFIARTTTLLYCWICVGCYVFELLAKGLRDLLVNRALDCYNNWSNQWKLKGMITRVMQMYIHSNNSDYCGCYVPIVHAQ